jgi:hypothetical protein
MPYRITFQSFGISNTRAPHDDTDYLAVNMSINQVPLTPQTKRVGNVDNGEYDVGFYFDLEDTVQPNDQIVFNYIIVNHGGDSSANVLKSCAEATTETVLKNINGQEDALVYIDGYPGIYFPYCMTINKRSKGEMNGLWDQVKQVFSHLSSDRCDGVVVIDRLSFPGKYLANMELVSPRTIKYEGVDSRDGCGSDSVYEITWTIGPALR